MKLSPKYSYEYNCVLNDTFKEQEQIKNFASLISDKDRFLIMLSDIETNKSMLEEKLGFNLPDEIIFYIVRAEKFKSFSEPITIEYSILPEEMFLYLIKEILKISVTSRFPDELLREKYINAFIDYILINGNFKNKNLIKYMKNLHEESLRVHFDYELITLNFDKKTLKEYVEDLYNNIN